MQIRGLSRKSFCRYQLLDDEVRAILRWGNVSASEMEEHESSIGRWGVSSVGMELTDKHIAALKERGRGWPLNGYELRLMKEAGSTRPRVVLSAT